MRYLNLGCGSRFHPSWVNIDYLPIGPLVRQHDLRTGVPYQSDTFDVVYHSHILEHFRQHEALPFLRECHRVLRPRGIIRVAVPDLEAIARTYVHALELSLDGDSNWQLNYEWMVLEMYDQTVRERSGGEMLAYLRRNPIPNEVFVYDRLGGEARNIINALRSNPGLASPNAGSLRDRGLRNTLERLRSRVVTKLLGPTDTTALAIGRFRLQGEVHQWMYDRYSLGVLLCQAGFQNPTQRTAFDSTIENWTQFHLDTEPDGTVYKPDSLFMEAIKAQ